MSDRYLDVAVAAPDLDYEKGVLVELAYEGRRCEECPQASEEFGGVRWHA